MRKLLVLLGTCVIMSGCFICHKSVPQEEIVVIQEIIVQESPVSEEDVITRYSIPEVANFAFDSKEAEDNMEKMNELDQDIKAHPKAVILVEGHTDNIGSEEYNKDLSLERARAVAAKLQQKNYPNQIRLYGAGYSQPIASNDTEEGRAKNRRVDVVLVRGE